MDYTETMNAFAEATGLGISVHHVISELEDSGEADPVALKELKQAKNFGVDY